VSGIALALHDIHKSFGATVALAGANCAVRHGSVHALLGENGAGKTTLMRTAFGMLVPDAGRVELRGAPVRFTSPRAAIAAGIGMVHQHFELVPAFTVAENVALGGRGRYSASAAAARVAALAADTGLPVDPQARVADLPVGAQQRAELLRALAHDASVLILDEPTAVLTPRESDDLYRWMRRFADGGGTVVLITHKLREALAVADDITVLRRGRTVLQARTDALDEQQVVEAILGDRLAVDEAPPLAATTGEAVLALDEATVVDARGVVRLHPTRLAVRRGEILGVLGVEGAGQRELLRLLAGRLTPTRGRVQRPERVGFVPEDRLRDAVIPEFSLAENRALADAGRARGRIAWTHEAARAAAIIDAYAVRAPGPRAPMRALSGGNQQRFVVGRERELAPSALVAENPTRGLDVRAAAQVMRAIRTLASEGGAAVVYSTDLDEVLALTRRVVVCFAGHVREVPPPPDLADRTPYARALVGADA
jgi:simple sugar transport system ATP-binding protein